MADPQAAHREVRPAGALLGEVEVPGDKSISHRAVIFGALARGRARISGLSRGEDVGRTITAFRQLGVTIDPAPDGIDITGVGLHGLREPADVIDCGNSGTTARLLLGLLAGQPFFSVLTGDSSLRTRPMARVVTPLRGLGATLLGRQAGERLPIAVGGGRLTGGDILLPVASAQLKSALLLAGLFGTGEVRVTEPAATRDHTERAFRARGLSIRQSGLTVSTGPGSEFAARDVRVPGDISAAAFFLVAGSILPGSDLVIRNVGMNPGRTGILEALLAMGARIDVLNPREEEIEPVADLRVRSAELRVKESDRIRTMTEGLERAGIDVVEHSDGMEIRGGQPGGGGVEFDSHGDHRVAMSMAVLGLTLARPSHIRDVGCIDTSFPGFFTALEAVGGGGS